MGEDQEDDIRGLILLDTSTDKEYHYLYINTDRFWRRNVKEIFESFNLLNFLLETSIGNDDYVIQKRKENDSLFKHALESMNFPELGESNDYWKLSSKKLTVDKNNENSIYNGKILKWKLLTVS